MSAYRNLPVLRSNAPQPWRKRLSSWWHWLWCHRFHLWNSYGRVETWFDGYGDEKRLMVGHRCDTCHQLHQVHEGEMPSHGPSKKHRQTEEWREEMKDAWRDEVREVVRSRTTETTVSVKRIQASGVKVKDFVKAANRMGGKLPLLPSIKLPPLPELKINLPPIPDIKINFPKFPKDDE